MNALAPGYQRPLYGVRYNALVPTKLTPALVDKVWGATDLSPLFPHNEEKIGEVVHSSTDSALHVKFLFTTDWLSVQVHPEGSAEMWYVVKAVPGATVRLGFKELVTKEQIQAAAGSRQIFEMLKEHPADSGAMFFVPPGTVHTIGPGLVVCEIRLEDQGCYRLFDFEGRGRELSIDKAVEVAIPGPCQPTSVLKDGVSVSHNPFVFKKFVMKANTHESCETLNKGQDEFWAVLEGEGSINGQAAKPGDVFRITNGTKTCSISGKLTILKAAFVG